MSYHYDNLLAYISIETNDDLRTACLDGITLHLSFMKKNKDTGGVPREARTVLSMGRALASGKDIAFREADDIQHDAHGALELVKGGENRPECWGMDFGQYYMFNRICNRLERASLREAVMRYEDQKEAGA